MIGKNVEIPFGGLTLRGCIVKYIASGEIDGIDVDYALVLVKSDIEYFVEARPVNSLKFC